jgi:hypothetical protein
MISIAILALSHANNFAFLARVKRLGLAFKFDFKFPVGVSIPVMFISVLLPHMFHVNQA